MLGNYLFFVFEQIRHHFLRFMLTISGVAVGVGSLIFLASFIAVGLDVLMSTSSHAMGDDLMTVHDNWRLSRQNPNEKRLDWQDERALERSVPLDPVNFSTQYGMERKRFHYGKLDQQIFVIGLPEQGFEVNHLNVEMGRSFLESEFKDGSKVVVIGCDVLKGQKKPWVGTSIQLEGYYLTIVGVLEKRPVFGPGDDWSWNKRILLPANTYNLLFNPDKTPDAIVAKVSLFGQDISLEESMGAARDLIDRVLMMTRQVKNFRISGGEEQDSNADTILLVIKVLMVMTTVFSMLVGGINIMNIMLVTVTERTREIGIRRALGASKRDIISQFLIESVLVTLSGAFIGLVSGVALTYVLGLVLTKTFYPWPFQLEWWSIALSVSLSIVIGVIFGISPAAKAAKLDPVEALRSE